MTVYSKSSNRFNCLSRSMGFQRFDIELDNNVGVFFPGQVVSGKICILNNSSVKTFKSLHLECKGMAKVRFSVRQGKRTRVRQSSIQYFDYKRSLTEGQESLEINTGLNQFPFWFTLPENIPSSYESNEGNVRYTVGAVLLRTWKPNLKFTMSFTVNTIVDLNLNPQAQLEGKGCKSKSLGFCISGSLRASIRIERTGYVPGENILFSAEIDNESGAKIKGSKVQLIETATYSAEGAKRVSERILHEEMRGSFREAFYWDRVPIPVPPVAPSGLPFCSIIDVSYRIKFGVIYVGCSAVVLVINLGIIIGNVPLRSSFPSFSNELQPSAPFLPSPHDHNAPSYEDLPPPSYEQAILASNFQGEEDPDDFNNGTLIEFNPRYATYRRSGQ